ncbi:hypothetical protein BXZ70DRAFT_1067931 [Cristinia sonorae]|uniref:Extracellular membrane protein CFEM domain-containing protein n=1 Tax=Cristinia sonorae TaxID=1940300 RepID=A0A8K0XL04_9AGAR|nr:hypothetical protein BXZ70DRAFT_1067931 [Cristinia sonorae]
MIVPLSLVSVALLVSQVGARAVSARSFAKHLLTRQEGDGDSLEIPPVCQPACKVIIDFLNDASCDTPECVCTDAHNTGLVSCYNCLVEQGLGKASVAQQSVTEFSQDCIAQGHPLPALTLGATDSPTPTDSSSSSSTPATADTTTTTGSSSRSTVSSLPTSSPATVPTAPPTTTAPLNPTATGDVGKTSVKTSVALGAGVIGAIVAWGL